MQVAITWPEGARAVAFASLLESRGDVVTPIPGALRDRASLRSRLRGVDALVHLPALPAAPGPRPTDHPMVIETFELLAAAMTSNVGRFVLAMPHATPTVPTERRPEFWCEKIVTDAAEQGMDAMIVNHGAPIGPFARASSPLGRLVLAMARRPLRLLVPWRADCIDVRDLAQGILGALQAGTRGRRYILRGHVRRELDLARAVHQFTGRSQPTHVIPRGVVGLLRYFAHDRGTFAAGSALQDLVPPESANDAVEISSQARPFESSVGDTLRWFDERGLITAH